jgi:hypothetical protein
MIILLEISIIAAFVLVAIYMLRRPVVTDEIDALNERVDALEAFVSEQARRAASD